MKVTYREIVTRYMPALVLLSKSESITGKIAYACGRIMSKLNSAIADVDASRKILLESTALKDEKGQPVIVEITKQEGNNEDGSPKMVVQRSKNGAPLIKYKYESQQAEDLIVREIIKLEDMPSDVEIYKISASDIIDLKTLKDGGQIIFDLGDLINHDA